jgi:hypothetical protein
VSRAPPLALLALGRVRRALMTPPEPSALLLLHATRLAAAFELSITEVQADAHVIVTWAGTHSDLGAWLNARHHWSSDEGRYFISWVRQYAWLGANEHVDSV